MISTHINSISTLTHALHTGELSLKEYIDELEAWYEKREPSVEAFVPEEGRFDRLRRDVEALLVQYPRPDDRPLLFGIPVGVKDIIHVDGLLTRAGSRVPPHEIQGPEAECITLLKNAGALIMGKTVSTEFAYFGPGPTRNPHNPEHTPGGSSSGSAAAVAAGLCPLALGTQTIGSVVRPASFCGVVGYKPSFDRISTAGVMPLSPSLDHVGIFTADANGAALAARVLCRDWRLTGASRRPVLAIPEGPYLTHASDEALDHFNDTRRRLAAAGYTILSVTTKPDFDEIRVRHSLILAAEAARVHEKMYARFRDLYHPRTVELVERGQKISDEALAQALSGRKKLRMELTHLMNVHGIDLWISPSAPGPAPQGLESTGDPIMNLPWTHSGLPSMNVPSGHAANGLPLGLQLTARWHADELMLAWAVDIETVVSRS